MSGACGERSALEISCSKPGLQLNICACDGIDVTTFDEAASLPHVLKGRLLGVEGQDLLFAPAAGPFPERLRGLGLERRLGADAAGLVASFSEAAYDPEPTRTCVTLTARGAPWCNGSCALRNGGMFCSGTCTLRQWCLRVGEDGSLCEHSLAGPVEDVLRDGWPPLRQALKRARRGLAGFVDRPSKHPPPDRSMAESFAAKTASAAENVIEEMWEA